MSLPRNEIIPLLCQPSPTARSTRLCLCVWCFADNLAGQCPLPTSAWRSPHFDRDYVRAACRFLAQSVPWNVASRQLLGQGLHLISTEHGPKAKYRSFSELWRGSTALRSPAKVPSAVACCASAIWHAYAYGMIHLWPGLLALCVATSSSQDPHAS